MAKPQKPDHDGRPAYDHPWRNAGQQLPHVADLFFYVIRRNRYESGRNDEFPERSGIPRRDALRHFRDEGELPPTPSLWDDAHKCDLTDPEQVGWTQIRGIAQ